MSSSPPSSLVTAVDEATAPTTTAAPGTTTNILKQLESITKAMNQRTLFRFNKDKEPFHQFKMRMAENTLFANSDPVLNKGLAQYLIAANRELLGDCSDSIGFTKVLNTLQTLVGMTPLEYQTAFEKSTRSNGQTWQEWAIELKHLARASYPEYDPNVTPVDASTRAGEELFIEQQVIRRIGITLPDQIKVLSRFEQAFRHELGLADWLPLLESCAPSRKRDLALRQPGNATSPVAVPTITPQPLLAPPSQPIPMDIDSIRVLQAEIASIKKTLSEHSEERSMDQVNRINISNRRSSNSDHRNQNNRPMVIEDNDHREGTPRRSNGFRNTNRGARGGRQTIYNYSNWQRNGPSEAGDDECYNCGELGHWARNCRRKPARLSQSLNSLIVRMSDERKKTICSLGSIGRFRIKWMIDLGATISCVNPATMAGRSITWEPTSNKVKVANGKTVRCVGQQVVDIEIYDGVKRSVMLYAIEGLQPEAILGTDVLLNQDSFFLQKKQSGWLCQLGADTFPVDTELVSTREDAVDAVFGIESVETSPCIEFTEGQKGVVRSKTGEAKVTINPALTADQQRRLRDLVAEHRHAFANNDDESGITGSATFHIITKSDSPITTGRNRRLAQAHLAAADKEVEIMLTHDIIEESTSPYCSPVVMVKKKDGACRFAIDMRGLNEITVEDGAEMPLMLNSLHVLKDSTIWTELDLIGAYWQLGLGPASRPKTAFAVGERHFHFKRMPFGVRNGPAAFARFMRHIMQPLTSRKEPVAVFFDNITIGGNDFEHHLSLFAEVLEIMEKHHLTIKSKKSKIGFEQAAALGYTINKTGIHPDQEKLEAVRNYPRPQTSKELLAFCGLINFYHNFIPGVQSASRVAAGLRGSQTVFSTKAPTPDVARLL